MEYAKTELEELTKLVGELIKAYGMDPKDVPPKEFFEIFFNFQKEFTQTYKNLLQKQDRGPFRGVGGPRRSGWDPYAARLACACRQGASCRDLVW